MTSLEAYRRDEFPVAQDWAYFNHASTGPLPRRTARAVQELAEGQMLRGGLDFRRWLDAVAGLRSAAARLIQATPEEIAVTSNTSQGLSFIANGIDWRPGDVVVGIADEFPANYFPWARLQERGVKLRWIDLRAGRIDLNEVDRACEGARLLAASYVQYVSGFRLDLDAAGEICRRRNCLFVVDAIQGLGPFPVDVEASGIHALSSGGQKWLLSPEGTGFLYVQRDLLPQVKIVEFGWTNVAAYPQYSKDPTLRPDAGRFEAGTLNGFGCEGFRTSIELMLEVGVERLSEQVHTLAERLLEGAQAKGYAACAARDRASGSGIVSVHKDGVDAAELARKLLAERIVAIPRFGNLRVSPHFYNTVEEIDRLVSLLP